ncbi:MAG TPA: NAD-dependent epimerase/dehydratase family protein [Desulfomonilaceae bacterium]|nr:NAD-dependent epimerase/dehydratase family protein [Desulfomonilaceae bacterium]
MHVLVVGGNGFIGSHVVDALLADKVQVTVLDVSPERFRPSLPEVRYFQGSFGDTDDIERALRGKPDAMIHLANYGLTLNAAGIPENDLRNLQDSVGLFEACIKHRVSKIVFMSSGGKVYGIANSLPIKESDPTNPLGSYGIIKLSIEKYLLSLSYYYGIDAVIVRPSNPFGIRQSPFGTQGAVPILGWRILHQQPITIWGSTVRDYIEVQAVARFCCMAATRECSGTFNLGSGVGVSTIELVESLAKVLEIRPIIKMERAREFDIPAIVLDSTRATQQFNWRSRTSLLVGLAEVTKWMKELAADEHNTDVPLS